jgi:viroplasmin and RNaseH domain-containing protein
MKNYDVILILVSIFVARIIAFSAGYADAICLLGLLAFKAIREYMANKKIEAEVVTEFNAYKEISNKRYEVLAEEVVRAKSTSEGLKAAINLTKR